MTKDKQIEEMANEINEMDEPNAHYYDETLQEHEAFADCFTIAKHLYGKGYRKASEVARKIFEELFKDITHGLEIARSTRKKFLHDIEKNNIWVYHYDGEIKALEGMECLIAEFKKKYTEGTEC